jgi:hypothetical protein
MLLLPLTPANVKKNGPLAKSVHTLRNRAAYRFLTFFQSGQFGFGDYVPNLRGVLPALSWVFIVIPSDRHPHVGHVALRPSCSFVRWRIGLADHANVKKCDK